MPYWSAFQDAVHGSLFYQLACVLLLAGALGFLALRLRQPLIVAFIATGLLVGPGVLGIVPHESSNSIDTLAALGIALLLFMVGLKLDIGLIRDLGPAVSAAGLAQVLLTAGAGTLLALGLGYDGTTAIFIGVAVSFSSTIIVVKLLSDERAIESLYGKIALGILIIQDFAVILSMVALAGISSGSAEAGPGAAAFLMVPLKVGALMALTGLFIAYIANPLTMRLARSPELMVILSLALAAGLASVSHYAGLSKELGGLLAGVALASTPVREVLVARLAPLRDFLLLFFFVGMASHLDLGAAAGQVVPALIFSAFALLGKPLIIMSIASVMGYRKRTGFMTGAFLAQISEFSLLFMAMGLSAGFVGPDAAAMITLVGLITFTVSTYGMLNAAKLYQFMEGRLPIFERETLRREEKRKDDATEDEYDIVVLGLGRYGLNIAERLRIRGFRVLGVDFDPQAVAASQRHRIPAVYGDVATPDFPLLLPLSKVHTVICAFPHHATGPLSHDVRLSAVKALRLHGYKGFIAVTSHQRGYEDALSSSGVDIILSPFEDAALRGAELIAQMSGKIP